MSASSTPGRSKVWTMQPRLSRPTGFSLNPPTIQLSYGTGSDGSRSSAEVGLWGLFRGRCWLPIVRAAGEGHTMARSLEVYQFLLGLRADRHTILHGIVDGSKGHNDD